MIAVRFVRRLGGTIVARTLEIPDLPYAGTVIEFGTSGSAPVTIVSLRPRDPAWQPGVVSAVYVSVMTAAEPQDRLDAALADGWQAVG